MSYKDLGVRNWMNQKILLIVLRVSERLEIITVTQNMAHFNILILKCYLWVVFLPIKVLKLCLAT